jgi:glycosyltransferase involved in cell wall biosynthesis
LELLGKVSGTAIELTIVGPVETVAYWNQCQQRIAALPSNIKVYYAGAIPNPELPAVYAQHHLFVLTTHGENFGHVIFESLLNGRPVLISDQTPWRQMQQQQLGWDIPLNNQQAFIQAIQTAASWNQQQFDQYCTSCWHYADRYINNPALQQEYLQLLG